MSVPSDHERGAASKRPDDVADSTLKEPPGTGHGRPRPVPDTQGSRRGLPSLEEARLGLRLLAGVPAFLRRPIRPAGAAAVVRARLATREASFLALMARAVYGEPSSPYRELLARAGCQHGDLVRLVRQDGVEGALRALFRSGVYLSLDELKGRVPVVRGRTTVTAGLARLRNPLAAGQLAVHTSGSRGPRTDAVIDLRSIRDQAIDVGLALAARGGTGWTKAIWGVPGSVAIVRLLDLSLFEPWRRVRWFAQVDPAAPGLHPRYRWSLRALRWGSWMGARPLSAPTFAPLDDPSPVLQWLQEVRQRRETPLLWTHASPAVRLSEAARQAGQSLDGVELSVGGEPLTPGRLAAIQASGARAVPHYASMEAGLIAYGCLSPRGPDDLHLATDLHAVLRVDEPSDSALAPGTVLLSSIQASARFILLNASLGDRADVVQRACECPLERAGWTTHLHDVRSFEKLTAGGMTVLDADVVRILEELLPARFGGGPTDYQLVEEEGRDGLPRLGLRIHPAIGPLDSEEVVTAFLDGIGSGSGADRLTALQWRRGNWLHVDRRPPLQTSGGKVLHLHRLSGGFLGLSNGLPAALRQRQTSEPDGG